MNDPNPSASPCLEATDERLSDWVDARMEERERKAFADEVSTNPQFASEVERFEQTVEVLRRMPSPSAPDDFLTAVQSRIRRRSRGRWFGFEDARSRFPYEAAFNIVLIGILFALYLSASTWSEPERLVRPMLGQEPSAELARLLPADAQASRAEVAATKTGQVLVTVTVLASHREAVEAAIGNDDRFTIVGSAERLPDSNRLLMRLRYHRGPPTP